MPKTEWTDDGMKWCICFFPLIGAAIGLADAAFCWLAELLGFGHLLRTAVLAAMPVLITGGIHFDGFLDTSDAISSWKDRDAKLEILKDPHTGAFAVICGITYEVLLLGFLSEINRTGFCVFTVSYVYSRALSGLSVAAFPKARKNGMLRTVADASASPVKWIMLAESIAAALLLLTVDPLVGGGCALAGAVVFFIYRKMSDSIFGGTTGDLAGWFLQVSELAMAAAIVLTAAIAQLL